MTQLTLATDDVVLESQRMADVQITVANAGDSRDIVLRSGWKNDGAKVKQRVRVEFHLTDDFLLLDEATMNEVDPSNLVSGTTYFVSIPLAGMMHNPLCWCWPNQSSLHQHLPSK